MNREDYTTPHFKWKEFIRAQDPDPDKATQANIKKLAEALEEIRAEINRIWKRKNGKEYSLTIQSGWRTMKHHIEIYRTMNVPYSDIPLNSYHLKGLAADFLVDGISSEKIRAKVLNDWHGGLELGTVHVHIDLGPNRRFYP